MAHQHGQNRGFGQGRVRGRGRAPIIVPVFAQAPPHLEPPRSPTFQRYVAGVSLTPPDSPPQYFAGTFETPPESPPRYFAPRRAHVIRPPILPTGTGRRDAWKDNYNQSHVLLLKWEGDHEFDDEVTHLARVFKKDMKCHTVRRLDMPTENSQVAVEAYIASWLEKFSKSKSLLTVYYGGHGSLRDGKLWFVGDGAGINWSTIQPSLENSPAKVLLLLDICFAGGSINVLATHNPIRGSGGTTELLAACGFASTAIGPGPHSFTHALIDVLKEMVEERKALSSVIVSQKIYARAMRLSLERSGGAEGGSPIYLRLVGASRRPAILLRSFKRKDRV